MIIPPTSVLILVDIQYDFLPQGALPTKNGDEVIPIVNQLTAIFDRVVATQDWHPDNHKSFAVNHEGKAIGEIIDLNGLDQILWPVHCVQDTEGAKLAKDLRLNKIERVFPKGTDPEIDSYSGFFDNGHRKATGLGDYLNGKDIRHVFIVGLATDYCVKYTALDALKLGFDTYIVKDACRGVELKEGDIEKALEEVARAGGNVILSHEIE